MTWKEGANDRRRVIGGGSGAEAFSGAAARYGDYVILGNVVLLCELCLAEPRLSVASLRRLHLLHPPT